MDSVEVTATKRRLFAWITIVLALLGAEAITRGFYAWYLPDFEILRQRLAGEPLPHFQKSIGQPYLLYVPKPGYTEDDHVQHNEQGYRGRAVPMNRTPGVARVLCLGGSTTYGWGNPDPDTTYPAQLQRILQEQIPAEVKGVEVINGGLPYGTSAEMLTHYHFKFHYFRPDLVIINTGGNDSHPMVVDGYQPDYSHWRQAPGVSPPLAWHSRWLMHSRLASLVVIAFLHGKAPVLTDALNRPVDLAPPTRWYTRRVGRGGFDASGFEHNLRVLIEQIHRDGAEVLLVPFRPALVNNYSPEILEATAANESLLYRLAKEYSLAVAPFSEDVISPENWLDKCHENAAGSGQKAAHIAPFARQLLWP